MKIKNLNGLLFEETKGLLVFLNPEEIKNIDIKKEEISKFYEDFKYNCCGYHSKQYNLKGGEK